MERKNTVKGRNGGARPADDQPKVVAQMPQDKGLKDPKEAALEDGYPGGCQF